jgi:hypothetical protein
MRDQYLYDYAILRVVPRVEREEFVNVGVILSCPARKFLEARIEMDELRVRALDARLDMEALAAQLAAYPLICAGGEQAGPIGKLMQRERFNWLISPKSTIIQTSPVHTGWCEDPACMLDHLLTAMVRLESRS